MTRFAVLLITLSLAMPARAAVRGHVLDTNGKPIEGATVTAFAPETSFEELLRYVERRDRVPLAKSSTSPDGSFSLEVESGASFALLVTAAGHAPKQEWRSAGPDEITASLEPAAHIKGHVTADGKPVVAARVVWAGDEFTFAVSTGPDGSYEVPDPARWAYGAAVLHPDFAPAGINREGRSFPTTIALTSGKQIRGIVLHEGKPVAGAIIRSGSLPLGRSGADGTFNVAHLPAEIDQIQAHSGSLAGKARVGTEPLRIELAPGRTLYGTVRDDKGRPLAGTTIQGWADGFAAEAISDSRGNYELANVASDEYVSATRPGYEIVAPTDEEDREPSPNEMRRRLDFTMKPVSMLRGRVVNEAGEAVAGAAIDYQAADVPLFYGGKNTGRVYSGVDGRFALPDFPRESGGDTFQLEARKKGYVIGRVDVPDTSRTPAREMTIRLRKGIQLAGVVVDAEDRPVAGAGVGALRLDAASDPRFGAESWLDRTDIDYLSPTDENGRFSLVVDAGEHILGARAKGMVPATVKVDVRPEAPPLTVKLERGLTLEGRVLRHDGSPVAGASVQLGERVASAAGETDASGGFSFGGLKADVYRVVILHAKEQLYEQRDVAVPGDPLIVRLARRKTITGHVRSTRDGAPIPRFSVSVFPQDGMSLPMMHSYGAGREPAEFENAEGAFSIDGLPPGVYSVTARAEGFARADATVSIDENADTTPEPVLLSLNPAARFRGRITNKGEPLPNVSVRVQGDYMATALNTDSRGEFELGNVASGDVTLEFERTGFVRKQESVVVRDDALVHEFTMSRASRIKGEVVSERGEPVDDASISAKSQDDDTTDYAWSDQSGKFTLDALSSGKQTIEVSRAGYATLTLTDIAPSQEAPLRIVMKKLSTGSVIGTVRGQRDEQTMLMISAAVDGADDPGALVDETGNYRLSDVPAGHAVVELTVRRRTSARTIRRNVEVPAGGEARVDFDLDDARRIDGRVTLDGEPLLNAEVSFEIGYETAGRARTGAGGAYEASVSSDGPYTVRVWSAQRGGASFKTTYTVRGSATFDIDIRLRRFAGMVVDAATGAPLPDASVSLVALELPHEGDASTRSDSTGRFMVSTAVAGPVRLRASHEGYGQRFAEFTGESASDIVLELSRSDGLAVRLIDARTGKPLGGTIVLRDGEGRFAFNEYTEKKTDGSIRIAVAPGQYTLSASSSGYATQSMPVSVPSAEVRIGLTPGGTLVITSSNETIRSGKLIMPNGAEYIRCECNGIAELKIAGSMTRIENVAPGAYRLAVFGDGGTSSYPLQVTEGGITTVAID